MRKTKSQLMDERKALAKKIARRIAEPWFRAASKAEIQAQIEALRLLESAMQPNMSEIVERTLHARSREIGESMMQNNALLRSLSVAP